ncbi:MAG: hypothetical protein R2824_11425 [Saprospiraceae bacterium]|nr:hypothetical protein [Lewinella sp.]
MKMKNGDIMELNSTEFLVKSNTWNLETTDHFKFYFDMAISDELRNRTKEAQELNYRELAKLMGIKNETFERINFWLFKDKAQKIALTLVDSDAHAISTFPSVYYLPKNATGAQEVGHVMTQKLWGFIPKTSNYSLLIDEGFNFYIDDERFYGGNLLVDARDILIENPEFDLAGLIAANNGRKLTGVETGSHDLNESLLAGAFVKFMIMEYGIDQFEKLWKLAVQHDVAALQIFEKIYGKSLVVLNEEFKAGLRQMR